MQNKSTFFMEKETVLPCGKIKYYILIYLTLLMWKSNNNVLTVKIFIVFNTFFYHTELFHNIYL